MNPFKVRSEELAKLNSEQKSRIVYRTSDIGRYFGMERIALHHIVLDPGYRTSYPHAESLEEEFILVLKGRPTAWIDGQLFSLEEGDCVGFPAGTGSAHTLINNDCAPCEFLVAGDSTKRENLCSFPVNPELKESRSFIWWENPPKLALGLESPWPKLGNLGSFPKSLQPTSIKNWAFVQENLPFSYQTCEVGETFSLGRDLTAALGLVSLGMYLDRIPPGKRSSWPHAHRFEDELLYVLEGQAEVWVNGETFIASPGDFVGFKSGTGDVHTVMNNSDKDIFLFVLGERNPSYVEQLYYSHHSRHNEFNSGRSRFWADAPKPLMGRVSPVPRKA